MTDHADTPAEPPEPPADERGPLRGRFWRLFGLGLIGIASLPLVLLPMVRAGAVPEGVPEMAPETLVLLSLINPVLYLAITTAVGAWLAPKVGLVSLIASGEGMAALGAKLRAVAPIAVVLGLGIAAVTVAIDAALQPLLSAEWKEAAARMPGSGTPGVLISGLLYGSITEEIMLRWGVLSLIAWVTWRVARRAAPRPGRGVLWVAIVVSAGLFGAGHLPAAGAVAPLDMPLVLRTIGLNALAGLGFGWLYVRYCLEAAMLAHAATHVGFAVAAWMGVV